MGYLVSCALIAVISIIGYWSLIDVSLRMSMYILGGIGLGCSYSLAKSMNGDFDTDGDCAFHMVKTSAVSCLMSMILEKLLEDDVLRREISGAAYKEWVVGLMMYVMSRLR